MAGIETSRATGYECSKRSSTQERVHLRYILNTKIIGLVHDDHRRLIGPKSKTALSKSAAIGLRRCGPRSSREGCCCQMQEPRRRSFLVFPRGTSWQGEPRFLDYLGPFLDLLRHCHVLSFHCASAGRHSVFHQPFAKLGVGGRLDHRVVE